jgi:ADP-heptose:LPS heptosyltransferase
MKTPLFFFMEPKQKINLKTFDVIKNKICILRSYGGLGDIIAMRMIFEDLKKKYPEFEITWAIPHIYFPIASQHPYIDNLVCSHVYNKKDFLHVYNLSTVCTKHEWKYKKDNKKNRSDIWANYFGLELANHNIYMPSFREEFDFIADRLKKQGWDGKKKLVAFAPISAIPVKNLVPNQCEYIKNITKDFFLFCIHTMPILDIAHLNIPILCGLNMKQAMAAVELSDYCISTDTGILHAAAGYKKPTMGIFSFVNGYVYCKYYPTVEVLQKHFDDDPTWCGPCHDFARCPKNSNSQVKPCITEIDNKMLSEKWTYLLNKYT